MTDVMASFEEIITLIKGIDKKSLGTRKSVDAAVSLATETVVSIKKDNSDNEYVTQYLLQSSDTDEHLVQAFSRLNIKEQVLLLNTALKVNQKDIVSLDSKHILEKDMIVFKLRAWITKLIVVTVVIIGMITTVTLLYLAIKSGTTKDIEIVSTGASVFFKTIEEIIKVIIFTEK